MQKQIKLVRIVNADFEIQNFYQIEPKLNDVYSRNNLPKINDM